MLASKLSSSVGTNSASSTYIEDVFSTYLYTGNDSTQTITNGIDLAGEGGLVWIKSRNSAYSHILSDTNRGTGKFLSSNTTDAQGTDAQDVSAFNAAGFTVGNNSRVNNSSFNYVSWTFRKQPKFFDVVTFTKSTVDLSVPHNLGSVPGCVIIKATNIADEWYVYHRGLTSTNYNLDLNRTYAQMDNGMSWISLTSTTVDLNGGLIPNDGNTYVMYLFAHDAGGFGLTGTDNVISCGSYTANGNNTIELGYEPQWIMVRRTNTAGNDWEIYDTMRGCSLTGSKILVANTSGAEGVGGTIYPTATGFYNSSFGSGNIIYIAIRRGPMKVPTDGTSVFAPVAWTGTGASASVSSGFPSDSAWLKQRNASSTWWQQYDRLRGNDIVLASNSTNAESTNGGGGAYFTNSQNAITLNGADSANNGSGGTYADYFFRRAPSFFDEVCYTGTGSARTVTHNLTVVPELMIVKSRSASVNWTAYSTALGNQYVLYLNSTDGSNGPYSIWNNTTPTSSVFSVGASQNVNGSGDTYVAYLFATCAGVSKVGSFTKSSSADVNIDCGFAAGARFVLLKQTDWIGNWYVYDTARGITTGNDPYLLLNSTAAEVTTNDGIAPLAAGFTLKGTQWNNGDYIYLAIA